MMQEQPAPPPPTYDAGQYVPGAYVGPVPLTDSDAKEATRLVNVALTLMEESQ